jgi:hypothetical protein
MTCGGRGRNKRCSICCRFSDAYAGKKAKLQDAALLNSDWASFNITDLPGPKTYPVSTISLIFASQQMIESGEPYGRRNFTGAMCAASFQADVSLHECSCTCMLS